MCSAYHRSTTYCQLSISDLSHSQTSTNLPSPVAAPAATASSTDPYFCSSRLAASLPNPSFNAGSIVSECLNVHDRMTPCFERSSTAWVAVNTHRRHEMTVTYYSSPGESFLDLVSEFWCLSERPVPSLGRDGQHIQIRFIEVAYLQLLHPSANVFNTPKRVRIWYGVYLSKGVTDRSITHQANDIPPRARSSPAGRPPP